MPNQNHYKPEHFQGLDPTVIVDIAQNSKNPQSCWLNSLNYHRLLKTDQLKIRSSARYQITTKFVSGEDWVNREHCVLRRGSVHIAGAVSSWKKTYVINQYHLTSAAVSQNIHYVWQNHYNEVISTILITLLATVKAFITNGSSNTILYKGLVVSIATWITRSNQARYNKICSFSP